MKKSTKILAILLAFVLVVGTLSIGALAASGIGHDYSQDAASPVEGEAIRSYIDFEKLDVKEYDAGGSITVNPGTFKTNNNQSAGFYYKGKAGKPSIVAATKGTANQYLKLDMGTSTGTASGGYMSIGMNNGVNKAADLEGKTLADIKYHVLDFDFYAPGGKFPSGTGYFDVAYQLRCLDSAGTSPIEVTKIGYKQSNVPINIKSTGVYNNYPRGWTDSVKVSQVANEWIHVTFILESYVHDAGTPENTADDFIGITTYNVVNGTIIDTYTWENGNNNKGTFIQVNPDGSKASACYQSDMTQVFIKEVRLAFGYTGDGVEYNVDNIAIRSYDHDYDDTEFAAILAQGKGADLTKWDRDTYDPSNMPMGKTAGAMIGDVEYTNLAAAVKAAQVGDTVVACLDSSHNIVVDKAINIDTNGKSITNLTTAEGYARSEEDGVISISKANKYLTVLWYECDCGEGCIEEIETHVYEGNNIYDSYKAATGKDPVCKGTDENLVFTKHTGFEDVSGTLDEFNNSIVVTDDLNGETIELVPTYTVDKVIAIRTDSKGNETYILESQGFTDASLKINASGITIKLLSNITIDTKLTVSYNSTTFDLNGYYITACKEGTVDDRIYVFEVKADGFTLMSSEVGGAIYNMTKIGDNLKGYPVISSQKNDISVFIEGQNDKGETTVSIYAAIVFQSYGTSTNLHIDGGEYIGCGAADSQGMFYMRFVGTSYTFKDATFISGSYGVFCFAGVNNMNKAEADRVQLSTKVTFDNCVFGSTGATSKNCYDGLEITFNNCYIGGAINNTVMSGATAPANLKATHVIKNSYVRANVAVNAVYAEGQVAHAIDLTKGFAYQKPADAKASIFAATPDYSVSPATHKMTFDRMIADKEIQPVETLWYAADGETLLATGTAIPGGDATAPIIGEVAGTNGMVVETYEDWNENTYIPLGTTGSVKFTLKEGAQPVRKAGKVGVMFNFELLNHLSYNHYVPEAPEGIEYVKVIANGAEIAYGASRFSDNFRFTDHRTGIKYTMTSSWPNLDYTDKEFTFQVVYTYEGQELTYTAPSITVPKYVSYVLGEEKYDSMPTFKTAMADLVRAIKTTKEAGGKSVSGDLAAVCELAAPYMSSTEGVIDTTATADLSALDDYTSYISYDAFNFSVAPNVAVTAKEGYAAVITAGEVFGYYAFGETRTNGSTYYTHNIRSYGLTEQITISIYNAEDTYLTNTNVVNVKDDAVAVASVSLTIDALINADTDADAKTVAFYEAFHAYAKSSKAYVAWLRS